MGGGKKEIDNTSDLPKRRRIGANAQSYQQHARPRPALGIETIIMPTDTYEDSPLGPSPLPLKTR